MGGPLQGLRWQRTVAIEEMKAKPRRAQGGGPFGGPTGAADEPAFGGKPAGERRCGIAQSETEEVRPVHNGCRGDKADGSNSSVSLTRFPIGGGPHVLIRISERWFLFLRGGIQKEVGISLSADGYGSASLNGALGGLMPISAGTAKWVPATIP